jgi:hypothetical protein
VNEQDKSPLLPKGPVPALLRAGATGRGLEIGPGSGIHLWYTDSLSISAIYDAEPATALHPELKKSAKDAGLTRKYHTLSCGAEMSSLLPALEKEGRLVIKGVGNTAILDSIVFLRVLCGVSDQRETIKGLYKLLKPGGNFVVYEHVANPWRDSAKAALLAGHFNCCVLFCDGPFSGVAVDLGTKPVMSLRMLDGDMGDGIK